MVVQEDPFIAAIWSMPNGEKLPFAEWREALKKDIQQLKDRRSTDPAAHCALDAFHLAMQVEETFKRYGLDQYFALSPKAKVFDVFLKPADPKLFASWRDIRRSEEVMENNNIVYCKWLRDFSIEFVDPDFRSRSLREAIFSYYSEPGEWHKNGSWGISTWPIVVSKVCWEFQFIIDVEKGEYNEPYWQRMKNNCYSLEELESVLAYLQVGIALYELRENSIGHYFVRLDDQYSELAELQKLSQYGLDMPPVTMWPKNVDTLEQRSELVARYNQQLNEERQELAKAWGRLFKRKKNIEPEEVEQEEVEQTEEERAQKLEEERVKFEEERRQYIESLKTPEQPYGPWRYIEDEQLQTLIWTKPTDQLAKDFGISGAAIAKHCQKLGLQKPPRGFWAKVNAGKQPHPRGIPVKFGRK